MEHLKKVNKYLFKINDINNKTNRGNYKEMFKERDFIVTKLKKYLKKFDTFSFSGVNFYRVDNKIIHILEYDNRSLLSIYERTEEINVKDDNGEIVNGKALIMKLNDKSYKYIALKNEHYNKIKREFDEK